MYITIKMYIITIDNNYAYHFDNFQEVVPFVKQEIRKHLRKNSSSHTASYDEWFFTDDVTIYECNPDEIDNTYRDENENLDVYGIRFFERQKNVIFYYEKTVKVIHVTYIPRYEAHKFIDLPTEDTEDDEDTEDTADNYDENTDSEDDETDSEQEEESDESENESDDEKETEENGETRKEVSVESEEGTGGTEKVKRERNESEKNIEKEENEFTTIN